MKSNFAFFKWGFFVLVALNLVLIFLVLRPHGPRRMGPPPVDKIVERLDNVLELNDAQQNELKQIFEVHQQQKDSLFKNSDAIRDQMMDCLYKNESCDSLWSNSINRVNFEKLMFDHHRRILSILDEKQKALYLDELKSKKHRGPKGAHPF